MAIWIGPLISHLINIDRDNLTFAEITKLIEAGVKLIAIDQSAAGDLDGAVIARTVTVALRPNQVAALAQAQGCGTQPCPGIDMVAVDEPAKDAPWGEGALPSIKNHGLL